MLSPTHTARFEPKKLETLREEFLVFVGQDLKLRHVGKMESGAYDGQETYCPIVGDELLAWIPEEDLQDLTKIQ